MIILEGLSSPDDASQVAARVLDTLREPVVLSGGHEVVATMSIGMALSDAGTSRDDLLHDADVAMYRAKELGRGGQVTLFDVDRMGGRSAGRLDLDTALHHAVERGEVEVYFQPLVSLADQRVVGAEALVRWDHPEHGILSPAQFIELAEDNGTILPIGKAVLEQACLRAKTLARLVRRHAGGRRQPVGPPVPADRPGGRDRGRAPRPPASTRPSFSSRSPRAWPCTTSR